LNNDEENDIGGSLRFDSKRYLEILKKILEIREKIKIFGLSKKKCESFLCLCVLVFKNTSSRETLNYTNYNNNDNN